MEKVEIDINQPLNPGDRVELHFKSMGMVWIKAAQIALIESKLESRKDFKIRSWSVPSSTSITFEVEVLKTNPVVVTVAIIAGCIVAASVAVWLMFDKAYQIFETPAGKVAGTSASIGLAAAGIALLTWLFGKK